MKLQKELRSRGLRVGGNKAELCARLQEYAREGQGWVPEVPPDWKGFRNVPIRKFVPTQVVAPPRPVSPRPVSPRPVSPRPVSPRPVSPRPVSPRPVSPPQSMDQQLILAVAGNDRMMVRNALKNGANPNTYDIQGNPVLLTAVRNGDREIVRALLEYYADPNIRSRPKGVTPLMSAVARDNVDIVEELLEKGANVNDRDNDGHSVLGYAINDYITPRWNIMKQNRLQNIAYLLIKGIKTPLSANTLAKITDEYSELKSLLKIAGLLTPTRTLVHHPPQEGVFGLGGIPAPLV